MNALSQSTDPEINFAKQYLTMMTTTTPSTTTTTTITPSTTTTTTDSLLMDQSSKGKKVEPLMQVTPFLKLINDGFTVRNDSPFLESVVFSKGVSGKGKHFYETQFQEGAALLIGWASDKQHFRVQEEVGVGHTLETWAFETFTMLKWHNNVPHVYKSKKKDSEQQLPKGQDSAVVVGCLLDLDAGTMGFYRNSKFLGVAFAGIPKDKMYYPAISLRPSTQCSVVLTPVL